MNTLIDTPTLCTTTNFEAPDDFYEALIETFQGLTAGQSHALNTRLVLILANHIGTQSILRAALAAATPNASEYPSQPQPPSD